MLFRSIIVLVVSLILVSGNQSNLSSTQQPNSSIPTTSTRKRSNPTASKNRRNDEFKAVALVDIRVLENDDTPESISGLLHDFLNAFHNKFLEKKQATRACVLVSFPTTDGDEALYYGSKIPAGGINRFKRLTTALERMIYRNVTESEAMQKMSRRRKKSRGRRLKENRVLFEATCESYFYSTDNGWPEVPIYVRKLVPKTKQDWHERVEKNIVPKFTNENETNGLLVVFSHFTIPKKKNTTTMKQQFLGVIYDLSNTSEPLYGYNKSDLKFIMHMAVEKIRGFVRKRLWDCKYKERETVCYYKRPQKCRRRVIREPLLPPDHPHRSYCRHGSKLVDDGICANNSTACNETCDKFTNWTDCNATCDGYRWMHLETPIPEGEDDHLQYCPVYQNEFQQLERCSPDCVPPHPSAGAIAMIVAGVILVVSPFVILAIGYVVLCREPPRPATSKASKKGKAP